MADIDKKCASCHLVIKGNVVNALKKTWHPEHFACEGCDKPITGDKFHTKDDNPWCDKCWIKNFQKICRGCKKPIENQVIKAIGFDWHEEHFVCTVCKQPLTNQAFFEKEGKPYCKKDFHEKFSGKCAGCHQVITEGAISALDNKWHQGCFKCLKCAQPVTERSFCVEDKRPVCSKCS